MKKTLWIAIVGALAASVIAASAQEVLSGNAVGYIKKTLPANAKLIAVTIPLDNMTETSNVFGRTSLAQEAPIGSYVYFWNEASQIWSGGSKINIGTGMWSPSLSNRVVKPGEAFFMKGPAGGSAVEVTITGEVPPDTALTFTMRGLGYLSAAANPYPVDFKFGTSSLAQNATIGSYVYFWNEVSQIWSGGSKINIGTGMWAPALSNRVVLAAEGFFIKEANTATNWNQTKPYTWP